MVNKHISLIVILTIERYYSSQRERLMCILQNRNSNKLSFVNESETKFIWVNNTDQRHFVNQVMGRLNVCKCLAQHPGLVPMPIYF
jgi:hypothetical protein